MTLVKYERVCTYLTDYFAKNSNYNLILDLMRGLTRLGKENCKTRRDTFKFCNLVRLILEIWLYMEIEILLKQEHTVGNASDQGPMCVFH